ncbi:MAG: hypothetical protein ACYDH6_19200 [Acidimicrobiales bacterium]
MKFKVKVNQLYAAQYNSYFYTNFPPATNPFKVTQNSGSMTNPEFGVGIANSAYLGLNQYYTSVTGATEVFSGTGAIPATVSVRAASNEQSSLPGCSTFGITYCVFDDYTQYALRPRDVNLVQGKTQSFPWAQNFLYNQSFESSSQNYYFSPGANHVVYCPVLLVFDGNCYLEFNSGGTAFSYVGQTVQYATQPGDNYTAEVALRCPAVYPSGCPIYLAYGGPDGTPEVIYNSATIPGNSAWYLCRLDWRHGAGPPPNTQMLYPHSQLSWAVYNLAPNSNLDVDFTTLALYTDIVTGTQGDPSAPPTVGPNCVLSTQYSSP